MTLIIRYFYRASPQKHVDMLYEKELNHQIRHCRGSVDRIQYLDEEDFLIYTLSVPSSTALSLIHRLPTCFHVWDIKISHTSQIFYTSKHNPSPDYYIPPKDPELKEIYWACSQTDLREKNQKGRFQVLIPIEQ